MTSSVASHASDQSNSPKQFQDQHDQTSSNEIKKSRIPRNFRPPMSQSTSMNQSTTSTDDQLSPVKRQRKKVKRGKKESNSRFPGKVKTKKCSSTSNDESNDASATDSSSEEEIVSTKQKLSSKMTYL